MISKDQSVRQMVTLRSTTNLDANLDKRAPVAAVKKEGRNRVVSGLTRKPTSRKFKVGRAMGGDWMHRCGEGNCEWTGRSPTLIRK